MEMYISCADPDRAQTIRLRQTLQPLLERRDVTMWSRQDINAGEEWKEEMKRHLAQSSYFVPVFSSDYFASDMCDVELQAAQYLAVLGRLSIIGVLVRVCSHEYSGVQNIVPLSGRAVSLYRNADLAWMDVHNDFAHLLSNAQGQIL
jgi:TIR domain